MAFFINPIENLLQQNEEIYENTTGSSDELIQQSSIKRAILAAQQNGELTSKCIKNYSITDQTALIAIAKLAAQQNGGATSHHIENYGITDQTALIAIAKLAAQRHGGATSMFIENYGITDQTALIEIAKLAAQQNGTGTSHHIKNYGIRDQSILIEIAKLAAQQNGTGTSHHIKNYGIIDQTALIEIAKLAAQQNGIGTSIHIKEYNIDNEHVLIEIAYLAIQTSILTNTVSSIWDLLFNYLISPKTKVSCICWDRLFNYLISPKKLEKTEFEKIQLLCASHSSDENSNQELQKFIEKKVNFKPSLSIFDRSINEIKEQIIKTKDNSQKLEKLKKAKQRALLYFSFIEEQCKNAKISLTEQQQKCFVKILKHRNPKESYFLAQIFAKNFCYPTYFSAYQSLISNKSSQYTEHLILPMMIPALWFMESSNLQKNIQEFLASPLQRKSLRDAKGFLPNLLQTLMSLHSSPISSAQKCHLLNQCFQFARSIKGKEWEKRCKQSLDTACILSQLNLLNSVLKELGDNYCFEDIISSFNVKLQENIFAFTTPIENFYKKYLKIENTSRIPLGLIKYVSNLKNHSDSRVSQELQRLMMHIIEGTVKQERYQTNNNPHLTQIEIAFPDLFHTWQASQEVLEKELEDEQNQSVDFFAFLKQKIITDKHFSQAPPPLIQYLTDPKKPQSIEDLKETDKQIFNSCKQLCDQSLIFNKKLDVLKQLSYLLMNNEFKNDINSLIETLTKITQKASVLLVDTDDWQDLFLSGTEVLGSCQRIDGDPSLNVCLMAYVLDGKNRLLAIKDSKTGKILARCIFRLLWDTENKRPALFQERIYPHPYSKQTEELLNNLAETRAKELNLELFTCNQRDDLKVEQYSLDSLGSCSPYEYVDASDGKTNGIFKINTAKAVILK
ncbi:MAG: hypothetical protein ACRDAI_02520 [Candidatus Rhabdochlamydia sp.]